MPQQDKASVLAKNAIDILEEDIQTLSPALLDILLKDKTTGRNIRWACDEYGDYGPDYNADKEILPRQITGENTKIIQPRTEKSKENQKKRTKKSAEVFTPSWLCNEMNNHCDALWFGRENVFNIEKDQGWIPTEGPIEFTDPKKTWQKYVSSKRLEITCGEAPYLVSRYDTTTGVPLPISHRIGIVDRKLRVVNENTHNVDDWLEWARRAFESSYGYEYQGDSLLIARENMLWTFVDNYKKKFATLPSVNQMKTIANIIAWNIWQMDGLTDTTPYSHDIIPVKQLDFFKPTEHTQESSPMFSKIRAWRSHQTILFKNLKGTKMKVDFVIGNPPYQGDNHQQLYPAFYLSGRKIANCVEMIFPTGWQNPKNANNLRLLNNATIKEDKQIVFINNQHNVFQKDVTGAEWTNIILWKKDYDNKLNGKQRVITEGKEELKSLEWEKSSDNKPREIQDLFNKVVKDSAFNSLQENVSSLKPYGIRTDFLDNPKKYSLPNVQNERKHETDIVIYGLRNHKFTRCYVPYNYPFPKITKNLKKYKVFIGKAWGNFSNNYLGGAYADIIIASPNEVCTENYLESGSFDDFRTAQKHAKYLMTKFCRALLFLNKFTQDNSKEKWISVPIQNYKEDFWEKSISEIDDALMEKYAVPQYIRDFVFKNIQTKTENNIINFEEK